MNISILYRVLMSLVAQQVALLVRSLQNYIIVVLNQFWNIRQLCGNIKNI